MRCLEDLIRSCRLFAAEPDPRGTLEEAGHESARPPRPKGRELRDGVDRTASLEECYAFGEARLQADTDVRFGPGGVDRIEGCRELVGRGLPIAEVARLLASDPSDRAMPIVRPRVRQPTVETDPRKLAAERGEEEFRGAKSGCRRRTDARSRLCEVDLREGEVPPGPRCQYASNRSGSDRIAASSCAIASRVGSKASSSSTQPCSPTGRTR